MSAPLTRPFTEHVRELMRHDCELRRLTLARTVRYFTEGDMTMGKATLETYIIATVGFDELGKGVGKSPESIKRMLKSGSNPRIADLFAVIDHLRKAEGVEIEVSCKSAEPRKRAARRDDKPKPAGEMALA